MTDVADRGPAPAQTGASAVKTGAMGGFVAIFWLFNDVVGLAILGLATLLNPVAIFVGAAIVYGVTEAICCKWIDANWDNWIALMGERVSKRVDRWRDGRVFRYPVRWVTEGSQARFALAATLTSAIAVVTIARFGKDKRVGGRRIVIATVCHALFVSALFSSFGALAQLGVAAAT